jgi:hypothetical protein
MRLLTFRNLLLSVVVGFSVLLAACAGTVHDYDQHNPGHPPPPKREPMGVAPYPGAHWVQGEWIWRHGQWEWVPGHYAHIHW